MSDNKTNSGKYNSGYRNSGDYNSGDCNSGGYNSGDRNSGDYNSGDYNSGGYNSGGYNSGYRNSGYRNSGDCNSGGYNSGDRNSGDYNSGDYNSGGYNSGDCNSGFFNTDEPTVRAFNKDTNLKRSDIDFPSMDWFNLTEWVFEKDMSKQEKEDNPSYKTTGGYLKTISYKEAWANYWRDTEQKNRDKILNFPNFDAEIFKEITGIDVNQQSCAGKVVEIDGKKYVLQEANL